MDDLSKKFLEQAKNKMERIDKTQVQLAKEIGVDYSTINKTFNNYRALDFSLAVKIADNLNISIDKIFQTNPNNETIDDLIDEIDEALDKIKKLSRL